MPVADLVVVADYQRETQDDSTAEVTVTAALREALLMLDERCKRHFAHGTYTETLYVYRDGKVYPTNTPIETVIDPAVAPVSIQGAGVYLGVFLPFPATVNPGDWNQAVPPQANVTYTGGYQPYGTTGGPTAAFPATLMRAVCRIAYLLTHPVALQGLPAGVKSANVGAVSLSGDLSAFEAFDPGITRAIRPYVKRQARGWQRA